ncbi:hypothetical protein PsorP6_015530 [Peronosclerospora sorghi]|uniref:Uncharacterized protein n=1 Tax=Peronosclerospora sorghi TaxID=230839 RepID=A0ACC0WQ58_9STRA|nr:hypothetical protein PsorP6_015530 [Peronosclerospora sorghi]
MTRQVYFILLLVATTIACSVPFSYADDSQTAYVKTTGATSDRYLRDSNKNSNKDTESIDADDEERFVGVGWSRFVRLFKVGRSIKSLPYEKLAEAMKTITKHPEFVKNLAANPKVVRVAKEVQKDPKKVMWLQRIIGVKGSGHRLAVELGAIATLVAGFLAACIALSQKK